MPKATIRFVMSVCLSVRIEQLGSHWTDFHEIWYSSVFRKSAEKIQVLLKSDRNNGYFTWKPVYNYYNLSPMRNVSDKSRRENQNTLFIFNNHIFRKSLRLWDNVEKCGRTGQTTDDNMIRRMRFECWMTKDTDTHCEYVILIAFLLQQWLRNAPQCYVDTYIACLVFLR